jgi:predicted dehydrogenase
MASSRREFGRGLAAVGAVTALGPAQVAASDKVGIGIIGCGNKGQALWKNFLSRPEVQPIAVADVYQPHREQGVALSGGKAKAHADFRKLLEDKDIQAIIVATPDHWHALATVAALRAGKDVYVEKPLSLFVKEGRMMVDEARKHGRVVQTGSQQRSGAHYIKAISLIRAGVIGDVHHASVGFTRNVLPGFAPKDLPVDEHNLDWDMWLGPAPKVPFDRFRAIYNFRWFWDYSGGQMTNFGAHHLDIVRWALDAKGPTSVAAFGGRYAMKDGGETPDVQEVIYQLPGCVVTWSAREINKGDRPWDIEFHGSKGTLGMTRSGFKIVPETSSNALAKTKSTTGDGGAPGFAPAPALEEKAGDLDRAHVSNFLECIKSRARPNADIEEGHRTAVMCHLGNIATRLGRSVRWDADKEEIIGDPAAAKWLARPYRKPWSLATI